MNKIVKIEGMICMDCVAHVEKALNNLDGIKSVVASLEEKNAVIEGNVSYDNIKKAVEDAGYRVVE